MERLRFDTIHVLLQVESQLGIVVRDRAAEEIRTMDQLLNFVLSKVGERPQNICVSSAAFYRLRRALGDLFGVPRECVRTNSHLEELVPLQDRQWHWPRLCKSVAHQGLSPLRGPGWS